MLWANIMNLSKKFVIFVIILASSAVFSDQPEIYTHRFKGAIKGVDVVAFFTLPVGAKAVKGSDEFTYEWRGATWKFSSEENRKKFSRNPQKYAPQYGGYCAFAVAHGFTTSPRPNHWFIADGKLYLNNNKNSFHKWLEDKENKIARADENWPDVLQD